MDTNLNETQLEVRKVFSRFFERESPIGRVRKAEPLGFDPSLWEQLARTDLLSMALPESAGGSGAGLVELVLIAEEYGRRLAPVPLVEALVAIRLLARVEAARSADWYPSLLDGRLIATLALRPASQAGLELVPGGAVADLAIALDGDRLVVGKVDGPPPRTSPANLGSLPLANCQLSPETVVTLARRQDAHAMFEAALDEWKVLTAAALVGLSERTHRMTVDYVKIRKAFGITLGTFQTVAHRLADDAVLMDGSHLLCLEAAWAVDEQVEDKRRLALMAFIDATSTASKTTGDALHLHGGVGFTLEADIQLYLRRAKAWPLVLGDPRRELQQLADVLYGKRKETANGVPA